MQFVDQDVFPGELILGDVVLGDDITIEVFRPWNSTQWYFYDLRLDDEIARVGVEETDEKYPIAPESRLGRFLDDISGQLRAQYGPA